MKEFSRTEASGIERRLISQELWEQVREFNRAWERASKEQRLQALYQVIESVRKHPENLDFFKALVASRRWDSELEVINRQEERKITLAKRTQETTNPKPEGKPKESNPSGGITPRDLALRLGVDQRVIRRHLRSLFGTRHERWVLNEEQVEQVAKVLRR